MSKHTPRPWRYDPETGYIWGRSVGGCGMREDDHLIAEVRGWGHLQYLPDGREIQDANGRLLAAAPDLLGLAELARDDLGPWLSAALDDPNSCQEFKDAIVRWMKANDAAIAKATGEQQ